MPDPLITSVYVRTYSEEQATHTHPFHQLVLPLAGRLDLDVRGRAGAVFLSSGVLVPARERHAFAGSPGNRFVVLDFSDTVVGEAGASGWFERTSRASFFPVPSLAMQLATLIGRGESLNASPSTVHLAWATLIVRAAAGEDRRARPAAVEKALAFIEARSLGAICVGDVARAAGVSSGHLHALFREHLGTSPGVLVTRRRLEDARSLLVETNAPIAEIALRCGFADQASLTHAMRRVLGFTPGEARRSFSRTKFPQ